MHGVPYLGKKLRIVQLLPDFYKIQGLFPYFQELTTYFDSVQRRRIQNFPSLPPFLLLSPVPIQIRIFTTLRTSISIMFYPLDLQCEIMYAFLWPRETSVYCHGVMATLLFQVTSYSLAEVYRRFTRSCCLHI